MSAIGLDTFLKSQFTSAHQQMAHKIKSIFEIGSVFEFICLNCKSKNAARSQHNDKLLSELIETCSTLKKDLAAAIKNNRENN